jgi:hypothetical protein
MPLMKTVEYWQWLIPSERSGKTVRTRYRMDEATALEAYPGAVKAPDSLELRQVPDTDEDMRANFTGAWMKSK